MPHSDPELMPIQDFHIMETFSVPIFPCMINDFPLFPVLILLFPTENRAMSCYF